MQICYIMIKLMFLNKLVLIKKAHQKSVIFATNGIFKIKGSSFNRMFAMDVMIY